MGGLLGTRYAGRNQTSEAAMTMHAPFSPNRWATLWGHESTAGQQFAAGSVLLLICVALLVTAWADLSLRQRLALAKAARPHLLQSTAVQRSALPNATERARINRAIQSLNVPWPALFAALEAESANDEVALLSIEPSAERSAVRVQTEGPKLDALLAHAQRLGGRSPFQQVRLLRVDEHGGSQRTAAVLSFDLFWPR